MRHLFNQLLSKLRKNRHPITRRKPDELTIVSDEAITLDDLILANDFDVDEQSQGNGGVLAGGDW